MVGTLYVPVVLYVLLTLSRVVLVRDAVAVPPGGPDALAPGEALPHAVDAADAGVQAGGPLLGRDLLLGAGAVGAFGIALPAHAADGVTSAGAETRYTYFLQQSLSKLSNTLQIFCHSLSVVV